MSFDEFAAWLGDRLGSAWPVGTIELDTSLVDLDSLQRTELWIASEDLGLDLPDQLFATLATVGDLFYYYETKSAPAGRAG